MYELSACICFRIQGANQLCNVVTAHSHQARRSALHCSLSRQLRLRSKSLQTAAMSAKAADKTGAATAEQTAAVSPIKKEQRMAASTEGEHPPVSAALEIAFSSMR
jgi:hypothetical protein